MKRLKLVSRVLALLVVLAIAFTACGSSKNTATNGQTKHVKITFAWWGDTARHEATQKAIDTWNKTHPNITVEGIPSAWDGYHDKLFTEFAANAAPDIFQISYNRFTEFAKQNIMLDLTKYKDTSFAGIDKDLWLNMAYDGKIYAIPTGLSANGLAYNKTRMQKLGIPFPTDNETAESMLQRYRDATRDTNGDGKIDLWGVFDPMDGDPKSYDYMIKPFGLSVFTPDLKGCNFTDPKVIAELKRDEIYRKEHIIVPPEVSVMDGQSYMQIGAIIYGGIGTTSYPSEVAKNTDKLGIVMEPLPWAGGKDVRSANVAFPISIYSKTKYPEECVQFLAWLLADAEGAKALGSMQRGIYPSQAQRDAMKATYSANEKDMVRIADMVMKLHNVFPDKTPDGYNQLLDIFTQEKNRYLLDQIDLTTFMNNVQKAGSKVIGKVQ